MILLDNKYEFINIFEKNIKREGSGKLLEYLLASDFFESPASTRFHCSYKGGLVEHSINVYNCLKDYLLRDRVKKNYNIIVEEESIAIVSLLHDICKINCYKQGLRNVKDEYGVWKSVPVFEFEDNLPYGHGEKSVYIISGFIRLTREEAFAIRYHMGFSGSEEKSIVGSALRKFPLAFSLSVADMEATYLMENGEINNNR